MRIIISMVSACRDMALRGFLIALLALEPATAFMPAPGAMSPRQRVPTARRRDVKLSADPYEGLHGTESRFLSLTQLVGDEVMPRIVQIAGLYPGLSAQDLMAPTSTAGPERGRWAYDFSDPDGPQMGTVALPGSDLVHDAIDPVVVIASNQALGVYMYGEDVETLVLIDRADLLFNPRKFYAFATPEGAVSIRWFDDVPAGWTILGRVLYVTLPHLPKYGKKKSGFLEEDED